MDKRKFTKKEKDDFRKYAEKHAPKSNIFSDCFIAFIIGGLICVLGQGLFDLLKFIGFTEENSKVYVPVILIFLSCMLTGIGLYDKLAKYAGAGTLVPITGFANAVASSALDSKSEGYIFGVGAKMFTIAGPVILYGTTASIVWGLIYYFRMIL